MLPKLPQAIIKNLQGGSPLDEVSYNGQELRLYQQNVHQSFVEGRNQLGCRWPPPVHVFEYLRWDDTTVRIKTLESFIILYYYKTRWVTGHTAIFLPLITGLLLKKLVIPTIATPITEQAAGLQSFDQMGRVSHVNSRVNNSMSEL